MSEPSRTLRPSRDTASTACGWNVGTVRSGWPRWGDDREHEDDLGSQEYINVVCQMVLELEPLYVPFCNVKVMFPTAECWPMQEIYSSCFLIIQQQSQNPQFMYLMWHHRKEGGAIYIARWTNAAFSGHRLWQTSLLAKRFPLLSKCVGWFRLVKKIHYVQGFELSHPFFLWGHFDYCEGGLGSTSKMCSNIDFYFQDWFGFRRIKLHLNSFKQISFRKLYIPEHEPTKPQTLLPESYASNPCRAIDCDGPCTLAFLTLEFQSQRVKTAFPIDNSHLPNHAYLNRKLF